MNLVPPCKGALLAAAVALLAGSPEPAAGEPTTFQHDLLDSVLTRHVDAEGRVDYPGLAADPGRLEAYLDRLARCRPATCPDRFPTRTHALAYWINAYNAFVLHGVVEAWPLDSVADVEGGLEGFFATGRFVAGGDTLSLNQVENDIIRPRFEDPRIHFAVNCAAVSCPDLDDRAYRAADIDAHLNAQARRFAADPQHVRVEADTVRLSKIMEWYGQDFVRWFPQDRADSAAVEANLVDYVRHYAPAGLAARLPAADRAVIRFADYDWSLNRQEEGDSP